MSIELEILKRIMIMEAEGDEVDTTEGAEEETDAPEEETPAPEKDAPKPGTFEDDPMSFILKKYVTLNSMLEELMTPAFKEYVEAIFIVAPKPTTFKVLLHNGQYFFLTYLGKAYQATITGRNYYLTEIGEKERCMFAISRILRYGSPLKTKGPEGAEQGTREGEEAGGEAPPEAGAGGGAEGGEVDTTAGAAEDLKESREILKRIMMMSEAKADDRALLKAIMDYISNNSGANVTSIKSDNGGPHFRADLKTEQDLTNAVFKALTALKIPHTAADVEIVEPGEFSHGSRSGTFHTHVVTLKKPVGEYPKGMQAHIVRNVKVGSNIAGKSLTPTNLGLDGKAYKTGNEIINDSSKKIATLPNKNVSKLLLSMLKDFELETKQKEIDDLGTASGYSKKINFTAGTQKLIATMSPEDINVIGKDFGEVLGAIVLGNVVKMAEDGVIKFPKGNEALVDFEVNGYKISAKYKQGAAASLTTIIKKTEPDSLTTDEEVAFYNLFKTAFSLSPAAESHIYIADQVNAPGVKSIISKMTKSAKLKKGETLSVEDINNYMLNNVLLGYKKFPKTKTDPKADSLIQKAFGSFFEASGTGPKYPIDWSKLATSNQQFGILTSPIAYAAGKALNANPSYVNILKTIMSKQEIKQLYLDIDIKGNSASFKLKAFSDPNVDFYFTPGNVSVYNPNNGSMAFKMK